MTDYDRAYYAAHRDEILAKQRAKRGADPEPGRAYMRDYSRRPGVRERKAAYDRRYRAANLARRRRQAREYVAAHADEKRAYKAAWYQANRDRVLEKQRAQHEADPEVCRRRARQWRHEQPTKAAASSAAKHANRAAERWDEIGRISTETILDLWRRQPVCVDCGEGRGLDHVIPLSRGGTNTSGNLANRCRRCNSRKGSRMPEEMAA